MKYEGAPKKEEPKQENPELTQEEFDAKILEEAKNLGTNLEELNQLINSYGGPEKFKEYFEGPGMYGGGKYAENKAGENLHHLDYEEWTKKGDAKTMAIAGTVLAGITAFMDKATMSMTALGMTHEQFSSQLDNLKEAWSRDPLGVSLFGGTTILMGLMSGGMLIKAIKDRVDARKIKRQKQKDELTYKMTDTNFKKE